MIPRHEKTAGMLKVLSVGSRLRIVELLRGRALCVNALAAGLGLTPGAVSQHLRIMRDAGLVIGEKAGYFVHYRLNERALAAWRAEIDCLLDPGAGKSGGAKGGFSCPAKKKKTVNAGTRRS